MATINSLLAHLDEGAIAQRIGIAHDEARLSYHLPSNKVTSFDQFRDLLFKARKLPKVPKQKDNGKKDGNLITTEGLNND